MNLINRRPKPESPRPDGARYQIVVEARLGRRWKDWFEGFELIEGDDGRTILVGFVRDQAALHAALSRIRDLGVPLVNVSRLESDGQAGPGEG